MNSLDPWRLIVTDPSDNVVVPAPYYGHPLYQEVPSWIHYGDGGGTQRLLFDGAFIGADVPPAAPQRSGLTADLAPVVAPATGGVSVKKELDDKQVLHVEICVDGKCYRSSMDLAPAIALLMQKLSQVHAGMHDGSAPAPHLAQAIPPSAVVGCVESAVGQAVETIVTDLVGCHCDTVCGSFLDDIGNAVKGAASGIAGAAGSLASGVAGGVASTIQQLKGPIGAAAGVAAASAAAAIPGVGAIAAPIAGKLANDLVQAAAGSDAAKKQVAAAQQQAKTDPVVAAAYDAASKAVAHSTVAHHVRRTARHAAQGNTAAQQQIAKVLDDAQRGDPAAQAVMNLIASVFQNAGAAGSSPAAVSGWYDVVVGASPVDAVRARAKELATARPGAAVGAIHALHDGHWHVYSFNSLDDAIDWLQRATHDRTSFTYAAAYEKGADGTAYIQGEEIGGRQSAWA